MPSRRAPVFEIAANMNMERAANSAMLGILQAIGATGLNDDAFTNIMKETFAGKPQLIEPNEKVFQSAMEWATTHKAKFTTLQTVK